MFPKHIGQTDPHSCFKYFTRSKYFYHNITQVAFHTSELRDQNEEKIEGISKQLLMLL